MYQLLEKKRKNSRKYEQVIFQTETELDMSAYLQTWDYVIGESPYIFTHIPVRERMTSKDAIIVCQYRGIICSPEKLYNLLKK